jgi:hypothetical protein
MLLASQAVPAPAPSVASGGAPVSAPPDQP